MEFKDHLEKNNENYSTPEQIERHEVCLWLEIE